MGCRANEMDKPELQIRRRICYKRLTESGRDCLELPGEPDQQRPCGDMLCPTPPKWSNWGPWESCTKACKEEGHGTQQRRRVCINGRNSEQNCLNTQLTGDKTESRECFLENIRCSEGLANSAWGDWGKCSLSCIPRDGTEAGVQFRTRPCLGNSTVCKACDDCDACGLCDACYICSTVKQFRGCQNLELCPEQDPCHTGFYRTREDGDLFKGCYDTENNGTSWCPRPGGVDKNLVVIPGKAVVCTKDHVPGLSRAENKIEDCDKAVCEKNPESLGVEYCNVLLKTESESGKTEIREDIEFL